MQLKLLWWKRKFQIYLYMSRNKIQNAAIYVQMWIRGDYLSTVILKDVQVAHHKKAVEDTRETNTKKCLDDTVPYGD